ncbi:MAG: dephospho-CoA kinase [Gammaproteobacteria bacterium]|nr:dephospho-CoA kinase [Gammaproteobacteria bacterium]MYD00908.1 dephospho-CoA kinase [Gammaproteobacteria bacterium]MYI25002.1 dephospho-CoA kinase [Gammaproteobacteria bacterium]
MDRAMNTRFTVGLTGGIASGKSLAADRLASLGAAVVDTDVISREQTAAGMPALAEIGREFGAGLIRGNGTLDRARLREHVFSNPEARKRLEAILHPRIRKAAWERAGRTAGSYLVMVVPLLVETGFIDGIDRVLVIDAPRKLQIGRLRERDGVTRGQAMAILASQASRRQRRAMADDVILNDGSRRRLIGKVDEVHAVYVRQAKVLREH